MSAEVKPAAELSPIDAKGKGVRVQFYWVDDRFRHVIDAVGPDNAVRILESIEGDGEQAWPLSPPYQHLTANVKDSGEPVILVTGSAGDCHWSMAIEVAVQTFTEDARTNYFGSGLQSIEPVPFLLFDVACRIKSEPSWLGSSFRAPNGRECSETGPFVFAEDWILGPRLNFVDPDRPEVIRECRSKIVRSAEGSEIVQVTPPEHRVIRPPATVRWTYGVFAHNP